MAKVKANTNWFAIWMTVAVVVIVAVIAGVVVWANTSSSTSASDPGTLPESSIIDTDTGAIAVGSGDQTLDTYVDFMCPICGTFESVYGSTIETLADDGTITLNIHPISILDGYSSGTKYSTRAANAMYAVAVKDPDLALPFLQQMFANQPDENTEGLTDEEIIAIAEGVGATDVADDITNQTYAQYVAYITQETPIQPNQTGIATPTIAINGEVISNSELTGDPEADLVARFTTSG